MAIPINPGGPVPVNNPQTNKAESSKARKQTDATGEKLKELKPAVGQATQAVESQANSPANKVKPLTATDAAAEGQPPLPLSSVASKVDTVSVKKIKDPALDRIGNSGFTPLTEALVKNDVYTIGRLLLHGADPNVPDGENRTPLMVAIRMNNNKAVELLLSGGADPHLVDPGNHTPFEHALNVNNKEAISLLLKYNLDPNRVLPSGNRPPLIEAALAEDVDLIKTLLASGADPNLNVDGKGPLYAYVKECRLSKSKEIREALKASYANPLEAIQEGKLFLQTKRLGQSFALKGRNFVADFEGTAREHAAYDIAKTVQQFGELFPDLIDPKSAKILAENLVFASDYQPDSTQAVLKQINVGRPTFILTGFKGHGVAVLVWKDRFVICNRGPEAASPLIMGQYDPSKLTEATLDAFFKLRNQDKESYHNAMNNGPKSTLLKEIGFKRETGSEKILETMAALAEQKTGNCAWASIEGIIKAYLLMVQIEPDSLAGPEKVAALQAKLNKTFNNWMLFEQLTILDKYLNKFDKSARDSRLILESFSVLWRDCQLNAEQLDESLLICLERLEDKYLEEISDEQQLLFRTKKASLFTKKVPSCFVSIVEKNREALARLLEKDLPSHLQAALGEPPLSYAIFSGNLELAKILFDRGVDREGLNRAGSHSHTPLTHAILAQDMPLLSFLLERGSAVNQLDKADWSPLAAALSKGSTGIVKLLLGAKADPNLAFINGNTPLIAAINTGQIEAIKLLLAAKADPNLRNTRGITPLIQAVRLEQPEMVDILLRAKAHPNLPNKEGLTPLMEAVTRSNKIVVELLLRAGGDIQAALLWVRNNRSSK